MTTNLDDLSNDEIRIRLLEYGFANLPVTQTTRKVLIKKLKNAMETQKTKNRRETVAVIKASDDEDVPETNKKREKTPNRRATIAVTEKTKKSAVSSTVESAPRAETPVKTSTSRRSSRATPAKDQKPVVSSTDNAPIINEESDDDVLEIKTYTDRRSKTPTMTKSETVRTSYKNTMEAVPPAPVEKKKYTIEDNFQPKQTTSAATRRKTYVASSMSTTTDRFELPPRIETPTKFGKTSLSTSYNPSANYRFEKKNEDEEDDDDYEIDEKETPYLSSFAKRLSTLKAEPLDSGLPKSQYSNDFRKNDDYSTGGSYNRYSTTYSSTLYQQPPAIRKPSVVNQMAKDFNKLDRKYSIRHYVYIALIIMISVAIYVILFS